MSCEIDELHMLTKSLLAVIQNKKSNKAENSDDPTEYNIGVIECATSIVDFIRAPLCIKDCTKYLEVLGKGIEKSEHDYGVTACAKTVEAHIRKNFALPKEYNEGILKNYTDDLLQDLLKQCLEHKLYVAIVAYDTEQLKKKRNWVLDGKNMHWTTILYHVRSASYKKPQKCHDNECDHDSKLLLYKTIISMSSHPKYRYMTGYRLETE